MMTILRSWIFGLGKQVTEQMSHDLPTFYLNGALCYILPDEDGINLCFHKGYELLASDFLQEDKEHKHVRSVFFGGVTELEEHEDEVRNLLTEAAALNGFLKNQRG